MFQYQTAQVTIKKMKVSISKLNDIKKNFNYNKTNFIFLIEKFIKKRGIYFVHIGVVLFNFVKNVFMGQIRFY